MNIRRLTPCANIAISRSSKRGFTLLETAVAVGVLAVITAAIAIVFRTVGETVSSGKRLSSLTRRNAQIEQIMRRDFAQMVRDEGFLVIRCENAQREWDGTMTPSLDEVPLFAGEPIERQRFRRVDELMFFARGEFESARAPLHPSRNATSSVARIYYGHGQRYPDDLSDRSVRPAIDDRNVIPGARLGEATTGLTVNPNEFAADWSLLRHVTLLVDENDLNLDQPNQIFHLDQISTVDAGASVSFANFNRIRDNSRQVALQPAAQSLFRSIAFLRPDRPDERPLGGPPVGIRPLNAPSPRASTTVVNATGEWGLERLAPPQFGSGIVDIATVSLSEISSFATSPRFRNAAGEVFLLRPEGLNGVINREFTAYDTTLLTGGIESFIEGADPSERGGPTRAVRESDGVAAQMRRDAQVQQEWMLDALPTVPFRHDVQAFTGHRLRYENDPPRIDPLMRVAEGDVERLLLDAIERADQEMLSASIFLNACSEFIVEWSYGVIDDDAESPTFGQPIFYGLRRFEDLDNDGFFDANGTMRDVLAADIFGDSYGGRLMRMRQSPQPGTRGFVIPSDVAEVDPTSMLDRRIVDDLLQTVVMRKHAGAPNTNGGVYQNEAAITFAPSVEYVFGPLDVNVSGSSAAAIVNTAPVVSVAPLPWPKLIRITARLVDPEDPEPSQESTFQATFRVPTWEGL